VATLRRDWTGWPLLVNLALILFAVYVLVDDRFGGWEGIVLVAALFAANAGFAVDRWRRRTPRDSDDGLMGYG
jgi:hypothetical protein